ncbi:MAG: RNA polymerase sigma-70 factor [Alphaproteobacteria bacterium]
MFSNQTTGQNGNIGGIGSFECLFRFYYPRLKRYASYLLKNERDAEDLVQDVFSRLWNNKNLLREDGNVSSFLYTLTRNSCINRLKRKVVENNYKLSSQNIGSEELYHLSFRAESPFLSFDEVLHGEILDLISTLPEKCGIAFKLKWIEGKKIKEIAELMNISVSMVDKHLAKGLTIAKEKLKPETFILLTISIWKEN